MMLRQLEVTAFAATQGEQPIMLARDWNAGDLASEYSRACGGVLLARPLQLPFRKAALPLCRATSLSHRRSRPSTHSPETYPGTEPPFPLSWTCSRTEPLSWRSSDRDVIVFSAVIAGGPGWWVLGVHSEPLVIRRTGIGVLPARVLLLGRCGVSCC